MRVLFVRSGNHGPDPITHNQGDSFANWGYEVQYYDVIGKGIKGYLKNAFLLRKKISAIQPDIIHAHYALCGILASLTFSNKPIVVSLMGSDVNNAGYVLLFVIQIFVRFFWSEVIVKAEKMKYKLGISKVEIIPNGINLKLFRKINQTDTHNKLGWLKNRKNILFCSDPGRPEKNYQLSQKAINQVRKTIPNLDVHYLKGIPRENVYLLYNAANVLLLTSYNEGSPNVIKEAMACGCPIVATDVGDVRDVIDNTEGCYITSFETHDVADKIKQAFEYGRRTNGREKIKHLDSKIISKRIIEVYGRAIGKTDDRDN